jgi:GGDEF domain-containing protein
MVDRAMRKVTETLKSELRGRDIVGRWDRFQLSILLASAPSSAIESTFKRIQQYLEAPIQLNENGDIIIRPDPCIGIVSRNPFEAGDAAMERANTAMQQASSFGAPTIVYLSNPFIFDAGLEQI